MASLETTCEGIFTGETAWRRVLLGGLLCLSVVGIPWAAGYLFRYALAQRNGGSPALPAWGELKSFGRYWRPGWHFLAVFGMWYVMPALLAIVAGALIEIVTFGLLWWGAYVVAALGTAIAPALCIAALTHYQGRQDWAALWEFRGIFGPLRENASRLVVPTLLWGGLIGIFMPLLPFAFFLGFVVLLAYYTPIFCESEADD